MKAKMLKIAGVKSEKEFYKKFPTEEAFMKKHGKAFKKAQIGAYIGGEKDNGFQPVSFKDVYDEADYAITGSTADQRKEDMLKMADVAATQQIAQNTAKKGGLGDIANTLMQAGQMFGGTAKKGKNIKQAQFGTNAFVDPSTGLVESPTGMISADDTFLSGFDNVANMPKGKGSNLTKLLGKYGGPAGKLVQGIQQLKDEKNALKKAQQMQGVSDISLQASRTRPEQTQRRYVRPEDVTVTGEELFPIYGTGTNVLAKDGAEIANTFAPNTLYDDLGYEPLNDSERYKQFMHGGKMHKAQTGLEAFSQAGGGNFASSLMTSISGENAGGNIGGTLGETIGNAILPGVGGTVGKIGGQLIGTLVDRKPQKTKKANQATQRNIQNMALQQGISGAQGQYTSFMKDGGETSPYEWVSHTWQPQVIATFGEHKVKDLLKPLADADMLRAGGHLKAYTPPSERAMSTERPMMQEGGELQTHWGGYAEPMSENPYLPDGGETIMFRGQSHEESDGKGNTGIGITFGDNPVEVERGEPAIKLKDGTSGESSLVVFGNLKIPHELLGDPKAKGKKFKNYVADLSKKEEKANKLVSKSVDQLDDLDVHTPFDKLKFNSLDANIMGGNMKLKDYAQKKMDASALQSAMNDTVDEYGLETTDRGTIKAKKGATIPMAQTGKDLPKLNTEDYSYLKDLYERAEKSKKGEDVLKFQQEYHKLAPDYAKSVLEKYPTTYYGKGKRPPLTNADLKSNEDSIFGKRTKQYMAAIKDASRAPETVEKVKRTLPNLEFPGKLSVPGYAKDLKPPTTTETTTQPGVDLATYFNQVLPYLRPSDAEELDPNQLVGEMLALSNNQLEPVRAQLFEPELSVPYDISLQDILNENEASFRAQQRLVGYNPAAQSQLAAQKYAANQKVLGEQFRMNQAMKDQVYRENRGLLNQAKLQNLGTLDQQYVRQEEAKSKTKAVTQEALNSIAAKYAQNKLENRTLQTYENLYNYRFDPRFRTVNMNPLVDFQQMIANASPAQTEEYKKVLEEKSKKASKTAKNGSIVKALKNL